MVDTVLLTDAAVRRYKPGAKPRLIHDAGGPSLYLVIAARRDGDKRNAKSWMMRFRGGPNGKPAIQGLGLPPRGTGRWTMAPHLGVAPR